MRKQEHWQGDIQRVVFLVEAFSRWGVESGVMEWEHAPSHQACKSLGNPTNALFGSPDGGFYRPRTKTVAERMRAESGVAFFCFGVP